LNLRNLRTTKKQKKKKQKKNNQVFEIRKGHAGQLKKRGTRRWTPALPLFRPQKIQTCNREEDEERMKALVGVIPAPLHAMEQ